MPKKTVFCKTKQAAQAKFAPLTLDFTFKRAFANEQCKDLLLFMLNTFLRKALREPIRDVKIIHTVQLGKTIKSRGAVFDMQCEDASGARFIVEMQVKEQEYFISRSFFYLCMAVANLAKKGKTENRGKKAPYDYNIPKVYTLCFLNFESDFGKDCDEIVQYISLSNELHPEVRYDIVRMVYVRLALFSKSEKECQNDLDRLLFAFKNAHKLSKKPASFNSSQFKRLFEIAKISNFNGEEFMSYEREMKHFSDHMNALAYAKKKGVNEGIAKGVTQGVTKGIAQGILQAAKSMLKDGLSPARVARITRLPKEEVLALR